MRLFTDIEETPTHFIGRIVRPDANTTLDYDQIAKPADPKEAKKVKDDFREMLEKKAAKIGERIDVGEKNARLGTKSS